MLKAVAESINSPITNCRRSKPWKKVIKFIRAGERLRTTVRVTPVKVSAALSPTFLPLFLPTWLHPVCVHPPANQLITNTCGGHYIRERVLNPCCQIVGPGPFSTLSLPCPLMDSSIKTLVCPGCVSCSASLDLAPVSTLACP